MASQKVRAVTRYEALDGSLHDDMDAAAKHSYAYEAKQKLAKAIHEISPSSSTGTLIIDMLNKPAEILKLRDAINATLEYHRRHGKLAKKKG